MRYPEHNSEHQYQRDPERYERERQQRQPQHFHDARSRWEEPATPHDLYRNNQQEQEGRFRREGQFHQQQHNAPHSRQNHEHYNQNQGNFNRDQNYRRPDWEQYQHSSNTQQAPDRWREHNWQPNVRNEHPRPNMEDQYWNEQNI